MSEQLENSATVAHKKVKLADEILEKFKAWMKEKEIEISPKVKITKNGSCARYGMVATEDIKEDEVLFKIPKKSLLWPNSSSIKDVLMKTEDLQSPSGWSKLLTCLMFEYTKPDSDFAPYLEFLPKVEELNHPMFWTEEERTDLLKGTEIDVKVKNDLKHIEFEYETIVKPFLAKHKDLGFDESKHTVELYKHMVALVMAYSFSDEDGDDIPKMVPLADVLNHVSLNNAQLEFNEKSLDMIAQRHIKAGEEIYNTYGQLDNCQLLQNYGFIEDYPDNVFEVAEISVERVADIATSGMKEIQGKFDCIDEKVAWLQENDYISCDDLIFSNEGLLNLIEFFFFTKFLELGKNEFEEIRAKGIAPSLEELVEEYPELDVPDLVDDDILRYGEFKLLLSDEMKFILHEAVVERLESFPGDEKPPPSTASDIRKHLSAKLIDGQKELFGLLEKEFS